MSKLPELVVIGASAGGVQALQQLLRGLPAAFAPTVAIVLHVPSDRPSGLVRLFATQCAVPVSEALDKEPVGRGRVVVAPPDYHLLIEPDATFALSIDAPVLYSRPSIDPLFESAAIAYRERLLGIVLTGASSDGSDGLMAVRRHGGTGWVQDPATAAAATMPAAALERAGADRILSLDEMCERLGSMTKR